MSDIPADLKYTKNHEWIKLLEDGTAVIGITDHAQSSLGDVTFVEAPAVDDTFAHGETFGVVESVKAASDLYMPLSGTILEINEDLEGAPELVNSSPYEAAWMIKIQPSDESELSGLLDAAGYSEITG
jgi:glycine cleavage system H protein|tara:strand:+ start:368 stop:751 length:384 start_codon:yes stop_codon:yes gene_type:complete